MKQFIQYLLVIVLTSIDTIGCGRRHFAGAGSSSSSDQWLSDYSNGTRINDGTDNIIVIPVPVIDGTHQDGKKKFYHNVIRTNLIDNQWKENKKLINGEKLFKDDKRYYPCPAELIKGHWVKISHHLESEIYPYLPYGVNVTLICIKESDYGWFDQEYWQKDDKGVKYMIAFWILVLVALSLFCAYKSSYWAYCCLVN